MDDRAEDLELGEKRLCSQCVGDRFLNGIGVNNGIGVTELVSKPLSGSLTPIPLTPIPRLHRAYSASWRCATREPIRHGSFRRTR